MKVLFLDFDGVLNSIGFLIEHGDDHSPLETIPPNEVWAHGDFVNLDILEGMVAQVDPIAVGRLNTLLSATGAKVVISSTWRLTLSPIGLQWVLDLAGFQGEVIGATPWIRPKIGEYVPRGREIKKWLQEHPEVDHFAILDDDSDMEDLGVFFVKVNNKVGLQDKDVELATHILEG
jgi:hypothetical protein